MATMQATAVISAVDRASPVFMRVAQAAHNAANVYTGLAGRLDAVHSALKNLGTVTALPGVLALQQIIAKTQEFEKALVGVQIANIADNLKNRVVDFETIRKSAAETAEHAMRLSKALSMPPAGLLKAGEAALKMGLAADRMPALMEMAGSVHLQDNAISVEQAAEALGTIGINFRAGEKGPHTTGDYVTDITRMANQWLAAANLSKSSASRLMEGLRQMAPLYASMGESFGDTVALIATMTQAGLMDPESGTALKSAGTRMFNMTHMGRVEMVKSGLWQRIMEGNLIELTANSSLQSFRNIKNSFPGRLSKEADGELRALLDEGEKNKSYFDQTFQGRLFALINRRTGTVDQAGIEANEEKILSSITTGGGRVQMTKILQLMAKMQAEGTLTDAQLGKIFEGRHLSRMKALYSLITKDFAKIQATNNEVRDEFTKAGTKLFNESDAGKYAAMIASLDRAFVRFRQSEGIRNSIGLLEQFASTIATMPQGIVEFGGKALAASVGIGALGLALSGVAKAAMVIAGNPLLKALFLGGGALALGQPGAFMGADRLDARDTLDPTLFGPGAPIWLTFDRFKQVGEEAAQTVELIGQIGVGIVQAIQKAFGEDPAKSPLFKGLQSFNELLESTANRIKALREGITALVGGDMSGAMTKLQQTNPQGWAFAEWVMRGGITGWAARKMYDPGGDGMLRDLGGPSSFGNRQQMERIDVQGQAEVRVEIKVDGPGTVANPPGTVKVPLNTGKSMPDTGTPMP